MRRSDWERARLIQSVHFGEDPGSTALAAATVEFAAGQRARLERQGTRIPFIGFVSIQLFFFGLRTRSREPVGFLVVESAVAGLLWWTWHLVRTREERRTNLWHAEWYAAQRLAERG